MIRKIMTVDDSATVRQMMRFTLEDAGFEVSEAVDGVDAMKKFAAGEQIDMLITDLNMPNMNGIELIRAVRNDASNRFVPIIMLTTEAGECKRQEGKSAGASGWIVKPFKPNQVLAVVRMVLA